MKIVCSLIRWEHLIGFVKAKVIVALNADSASPMLRAADVGLVGDPRASPRELHAALAAL